MTESGSKETYLEQMRLATLRLSTALIESKDQKEISGAITHIQSWSNAWVTNFQKKYPDVRVTKNCLELKRTIYHLIETPESRAVNQNEWKRFKRLSKELFLRCSQALTTLRQEAEID